MAKILNKSLRVAIQMNPIEAINPATDSSFLMGLEAQRRGHKLSYFLPSSISWTSAGLTAGILDLELFEDRKPFFESGEQTTRSLEDFDVILLRQDPPFDMNYITNCHLLDALPPSVQIYNNPWGVLNTPEKLVLLNFHELMPPTLITRSLSQITTFHKEYGSIIIKPLHGHGGAGVMYIGPDGINLKSYVALMLDASPVPLMAQKYLPEVTKGDKRLFIIDGQAVGALNRLPADGEIRTNMVAGGTGIAGTLDDRDHEIATILAPHLKQHGILFCGIDRIGNYVTEVNVTSPTGLMAYKRLTGIDLTQTIWDKIELSAR